MFEKFSDYRKSSKLNKSNNCSFYILVNLDLNMLMCFCVKLGAPVDFIEIPFFSFFFFVVVVRMNLIW